MARNNEQHTIIRQQRMERGEREREREREREKRERERRERNTGDIFQEVYTMG